jgi:hypothetical protein
MPKLPALPRGLAGTAVLAGAWVGTTSARLGVPGAVVHCSHAVVKDVATRRAEYVYSISSAARDEPFPGSPELGQPGESFTVQIVRFRRQSEDRWYTTVHVALQDGGTVAGFVDDSGVFRPGERPRVSLSRDLRTLRLSAVLPLVPEAHQRDISVGWATVTAALTCPAEMPPPPWM